jgi:hypothetical protein
MHKCAFRLEVPSRVTPGHVCRAKRYTAHEFGSKCGLIHVEPDRGPPDSHLTLNRSAQFGDGCEDCRTVTDEGPAEAAARRSLETAERLALAYERTAEVLERSAALAEMHARRQQLSGLPGAADEERRAATRARDSAQRARAAAERTRDMARHARDRRKATDTSDSHGLASNPDG